jgi:hypothetical protein
VARKETRRPEEQCLEPIEREDGGWDEKVDRCRREKSLCI